MNPDYLEFLAVTGELDRASSGANDLISEYESRFPNNPLPSSFYDLPIDEELALLNQSLSENLPIIARQMTK